MNETKCNAPCVVNTAAGFHTYFCEKKLNHQDGHFHEMLDVMNNTMGTMAWRYLGKAEDGDSFARPLPERCTAWIHPTCPPKLSKMVTRITFEDRLVNVEDPPVNSETGFCCEKSPGHAGRHVRSGTFGPLGIKWQIIW